MPRSAAQCHRAASVPPLGLLLPLRPAITRAALFGVWTLFCALCAASRLCLVWGVRRDAQPRALRAAGLRGSSSSAPMQDFLACAPHVRRGHVCGFFRHGATPWPFAASVIPRPSPCASLRFARFAGLRRARCFPAPTEVSARRLPLRRRGVLPASSCFGRLLRSQQRLIRLSRLRRPRRRL